MKNVSRVGRKSRAKREPQATRVSVQPRKIQGDLCWGAGWGFFAGVVYLVFALIVLLFKGGMPESATPGIGTTVFFLMYPLAGVIGGVIVGLLRPILSTRRRAVVVGLVACLPASAAFALLYAGHPTTWGPAAWFAILGTAGWIGGYGGYKFWDLRDFDPYAWGRADSE